MNRYIFDILGNRVETVANCYDAAKEITTELYGDKFELIRVESNLPNLSLN